jgi:hypothetical protein
MPRLPRLRGRDVEPGSWWCALTSLAQKSYIWSEKCYSSIVKTETIEIPATVLSSIETLDELQDWLTAQNSQVVAELREARKQDLAGKFKPWKPRHLSCRTKSK